MWTEYLLRKQQEPATWEERAEKIYGFDISLDEPELAEGTLAFRNGIVSRRNHVERLLMRMIKRKEIAVTVYNHRVEGFEISERMRLDAALKLEVRASAIGFNELKNDDAWDCRIDTKSLLVNLESNRGWETQTAKFDWMRIERYARELYEVRGIPKTKSSYIDIVNNWHGSMFEDGQIEPTLSTLQDMISKLHKEYSS